MITNFFKTKLVIVFFISTAITAFTQESYKPDTAYQLDNTNSLRTIAKIGDIEISAREFLLNYNFGPAFLKRQKDSKRRYLDMMINEKALALEGYSQNLDKTDHVKNVLSQIKGDLVTEELFKEDVMSNVSVSSKEIEKAVELDLKNIRIKWLFDKSLVKIKNDFLLLQKDASFDSLFALQIKDSVLIDDRQLETTVFDLNRKNHVLMSIIDTLKVGAFTPPIKTQDGYYIVKVDNGWTNILVTESEWNNHNEKMHNLLFKQKMDSLSDLYVKKLLEENSPVIRRSAFNITCAWLAKNVLHKELISEWKLLENTNIKDEQSPENAIINYSDSELIGLKSGSVLLKQFVDWYNPRNTYIKFSQASKEAFIGSVQNIIWRMLRDKLLTDRALQRGLDTRLSVVQQSRWWEDKTVYAKYKLELAKSIKITDAEILDYYNNNPDSYTSKSGILRPFEKVKNEIKNILHREKYSSRLIHNVLAAKRKYNIEIDDSVLDEIVVDTENDPRAIEVYTVKKDGIFPRQPYPTIDSEWQYLL